MDVAQATLKTPCPCGSGRPLADCHGKGAPVIAPLPVQLAPDTVTRKLDLACGQSPREGFEGVDRWEGAQHRVNLFKFPWPFGDSSVAELHCSHFIEHIPMIEVYPEDGTPVHYGEGVDLFLRFFDECFRILVPGGWMEVTCPCARHNRAYQDPTHRRFIVSETFLYLSKEFRVVNKLDHYGVQCDFGVSVNPIVNQELTLKHAEVSNRMMTHEWNRVLDWQARLQSKKVQT
jgi:hypothetical protein